MNKAGLQTLKELYWNEHQEFEKEFNKRLDDFMKQFNINSNVISHIELIGHIDRIQESRNKMIEMLERYNYYRRTLEDAK